MYNKFEKVGVEKLEKEKQFMDIEKRMSDALPKKQKKRYVNGRLQWRLLVKPFYFSAMAEGVAHIVKIKILSFFFSH